NLPVIFGEKLRGLFRRPLCHGKGPTVLLFVQCDFCARISLSYLQEYSSLGKLRRDLGKLSHYYVLSAVETVQPGTPAGFFAPWSRGRLGRGCGQGGFSRRATDQGCNN